MSQKYKVFLQKIKDVEQELRRTSFSYDGQPLCRDDSNKIAALYTCWYTILVEDSTLRCEGEQLPLGRILRAMKSCDVRQLLATCKEAYTLIVQSMEVGYPSTYEDFKHLLRKKVTDVSLIGDFKGLIVQVLSPAPDTTSETFAKTLQTLCTWLLFPTKVNLKLDVLEAEAHEAYVECERMLAETELDLTPEETDVLERWFPRSASPYLYTAMAGHHGSGSTAEGYGSIADKYRRMYTDPLLDYVVRKTGHVLPEEICERGGLTRTSKVTFVPKTFNGYRTISAEPTYLMYWQEGLFEAVTNPRLVDPALFPFLDFHRIYDPMTQEHNRNAALAGSREGKIATIDLHAASDSIRLQHVKQWFRKTCLYEWLIATRSRKSCMPDGEVISLTKYAPMGNATTFLVETSAFAAITECAIVEQGGDPRKVKWGVYGDDIYVEQRYALAVIARLERNGFTVNQDKTLIWGATAFFRESCGVFAANGVDVTPMICSRKFEDPRLAIRLNSKRRPVNAPAIAEVIDLANRAFEHGYYLLRDYLLVTLLRLPQEFRPAFCDPFTDGGLWSTQPENHHLNWRWNAAYQCYEVQHGVGKMKKPKDEDGVTKLQEFLRVTRYRKEQEVEPVIAETTARRGCTYWAPIWTPVSQLSSGCRWWEVPPEALNKKWPVYDPPRRRVRG